MHCIRDELAYEEALRELAADGFTHAILHRWNGADLLIEPSFRYIPAAYHDGLVSVYRLADLRQSCDAKRIPNNVYRHLAASPSAIPGFRSAIISFHPSESIDEDLFNYLASLFAEWNSLLHLTVEDGKLTMQSAGKPFDTLGAFAQDNQVIHLLYSKDDTDPAALVGRLPLDDFHLCQQESQEDGAVIARYIKREFDCALVASQQPLRVEYDNGIRLENLLLETRQDYLDLQLWWSNLPSEEHSFSLQVFDDAGNRVLGSDDTIGFVTLGRHRIDISALQAGNYVARLIVYNFHSGRSVAGVVRASGAEFARELEVAKFERA